jgi:hypothetical protein
MILLDAMWCDSLITVHFNGLQGALKVAGDIDSKHADMRLAIDRAVPPEQATAIARHTRPLRMRNWMMNQTIVCVLYQFGF